jgi:hypothetical protein
MSGHKSIQMILIAGYNHYNKTEPVTTKSGEEEKKKIKTIIPQLSLEVEKLYKLSNKEPDNKQLYIDYKVKKATLDEYLEKYGKLLNATKDTSGVNATKIADIKKAYKILIGYYDSHKKKRAVELYGLIKKNLMPEVKVVVQHYDDEEDVDEYDDVPVEYNTPAPQPNVTPADNDGWTKVPEKKNPFDSFNKKKVTSYTPTPTADAGISPAKLEELIQRHEAKSYIPPAHRKIVEEEIAKRKAKAEAEANAFPVLGNASAVTTEFKYSGPSFKDIASSVKKPEVVEVTPEPAKKFGLRVVDISKPEPELIEKTVNGCLTTYVYKETDIEGNEEYCKYTVFNQVFHDRMKRLNEEHRIYRQFLYDREHKPWCKWMTFDEWCEFQDEVEEQREMDRQMEMEKYGGFGCDEEDEYDFNNGDYDEEYDEEDDGGVWDSNSKMKKEFTVESY